MSNNKREKEWKNLSKKEPAIIDEFDDIGNLNDETFVPNPEFEPKQLTEEEKKEIRKNILITLIAIGIALILLVLVLIFNPFKKIENLFNNKQSEEEVASNEKDDDSAIISELTDGEISLTNKELNTLISEIEYKQNEYFDNDTLFLFKNDSIEIKKLSDKDKLFLMSKTIEFKELINSSINNFSICNSSITISTNNVDQILMTNYNTLANNYVDFYYSHYDGENYVKTIKFTYTNGNYIGTCYNQNNNLVTASKQKIVSANKQQDKLYINIKVVFIKESGVYKEPDFKTLISNDLTLDEKEYMKSANTYRYTYNISEGKYVLTNVSLIK